MATESPGFERGRILLEIAAKVKLRADVTL